MPAVEAAAEHDREARAAPATVPAETVAPQVSAVLGLQQQAGNAAVSRLLQRACCSACASGRPCDDHEPEEQPWLRRRTLGRAIQRDETVTAASVQQAGPTEQREFVEEMITYLGHAAEYWQLARVDQATFDRVLDSWRTMGVEGQRLAGVLGDDGLRDRLRQAYTRALRALMNRAAGQLQRPAIRLYLDNIHRIFDWAWPSTRDFPQANEAQRRRLVQETTDALNAVAFSGFTQFDEAVLTDVLTRLRTLVDEELQIIANQLGADQALRDGLRAAYVTAIRDLLPRAAASMGVNAENLYLRFRYGTPSLIPDWADAQVAGITTPLPPVGVAPDPITGEVTMTINGVRVIFQPDGTKQSAGATTDINFSFNNAIQAQTQGGHVTSHTGPGTPEARIRTRYGPNVTSASPSAYGRGTTAADIAAGNTTLGFHEGSHGRDYLNFLVNNPFPTFTGTDGMTTQAFQQAMNQYTAACQSYSARIERFSEEQTDCVGITIEDHHAAQGQHSPVTCP